MVENIEFYEIWRPKWNPSKIGCAYKKDGLNDDPDYEKNFGIEKGLSPSVNPFWINLLCMVFGHRPNVNGRGCLRCKYSIF